MVKQMLKIAGVKTQKEFYKKYPTEAAFFRAHPEAEMLKHAAMGGSYYYADGGGMPPDQGGMQQGAPAQDQPQQGGGDEQMQQVIQFVMQALQQGMPPEEIVKKLVQAGVPQDQAGQLVQAIMQKMQQGGGGQGAPEQQGPAEEQAEGPQGQEAPQQEMAEGQAPMGMYGGSYAYGGPARNNSTYSAGMSYGNGGPFIPTYADHAYGAQYAVGGQTQSNELIQQVAQMLQQGIKPEVVLQQLVQAKIPKAKAVKLIQLVAQQMQGGAAQQQQMGAPEQQQMMAYGGPYMPLSSRGNTTNFEFGGPSYSKVTQYNHQGIVPAFDWMETGGSVKKYKKGGEYEMSHSDIQDLINKGYKIQYL